MPTTPWKDVLSEVGVLNDPGVPFSYTTQGDSIIGRWDIDEIHALGLSADSSSGDGYRLEVLPEGEGVFTCTEHHDPGEGSAGAVTGLSHRVRGSSGRTDMIKSPLIAYLAHQGWTQKGWTQKPGSVG